MRIGSLSKSASGLWVPSGRATSSTFVPTSIAGNTLWVRGDKGITPNGATAAAWGDRSGAANGFTATGTGQPTIVASGINGLPSLSFNGTTNFMTGSLLSSVLSASAYTLFVVASVTAISTNNANTDNNDPIVCDASRFFGLFLKSVPNANAFTFDSARKTAGPAAITLATKLLLTQSLGAGTLSIQNKQASAVTAASGNIGGLASALLIGKGSATFFNGLIAEIIAYNVALSAPNVALVQNYLISRYGIP